MHGIVSLYSHIHLASMASFLHESRIRQNQRSKEARMIEKQAADSGLSIVILAI